MLLGPFLGDSFCSFESYSMSIPEFRERSCWGCTANPTIVSLNWMMNPRYLPDVFVKQHSWRVLAGQWRFGLNRHTFQTAQCNQDRQFGWKRPHKHLSHVTVLWINKKLSWWGKVVTRYMMHTANTMVNLCACWESNHGGEVTLFQCVFKVVNRLGLQRWV